MKKNLFKVFSVLIVAVMFLTACAPSSSPAQEIVKKIDVTGKIESAKVYWADGRKKEANLQKLEADYRLLDSAFRNGLAEVLGTGQFCFANVKDAETAIAKAVMADGSDRGSIFNVTAAQSLSGTAAVAECTKIFNKAADYAMNNREALRRAALARYEAAQDYELFLSSGIDVKLTNDLLQEYGDSGIDKVRKLLADNGISSTDFSWLPTRDLKYTIPGDKKTCDYYMSGTFYEELPKSKREAYGNHQDALKGLYEASWNSNKGECTLYRRASLDYYLTLRLSAATNEGIKNNQDAPILPLPVLPGATPTK